MTLIPNSTCSQIDLDSTALNASNISNTLTVKINGGTPKNITVAASATAVVFNAASIGATSLEEGIYEFNLSSTLADTSVVKDAGCTYLLCTYLCDDTTLGYYQNNIEKALLIEGIKAASDCESCSCSLMLNMYNNLIDESTTNTCGCS